MHKLSVAPSFYVQRTLEVQCTFINLASLISMTGNELLSSPLPPRLGFDGMNALPAYIKAL